VAPAAWEAFLWEVTSPAEVGSNPEAAVAALQPCSEAEEASPAVGVAEVPARERCPEFGARLAAARDRPRSQTLGLREVRFADAPALRRTADVAIDPKSRPKVSEADRRNLRKG
jgi:hypothetical protein